MSELALARPETFESDEMAEELLSDAFDRQASDVSLTISDRGKINLKYCLNGFFYTVDHVAVAKTDKRKAFDVIQSIFSDPTNTTGKAFDATQRQSAELSRSYRNKLRRLLYAHFLHDEGGFQLVLKLLTVGHDPDTSRNKLPPNIYVGDSSIKPTVELRTASGGKFLARVGTPVKAWKVKTIADGVVVLGKGDEELSYNSAGLIN